MGKNLTDKLGGPVGLRVVKELVGRASFYDLSVVHEQDPVGYLTGKAHLMGDDAHGHPLPGQLNHDVKHLTDHFGIQGAGGLIKEHDLG